MHQMTRTDQKDNERPGAKKKWITTEHLNRGSGIPARPSFVFPCTVSYLVFLGKVDIEVLSSSMVVQIVSDSGLLSLCCWMAPSSGVGVYESTTVLI